MRRWKSKLLMLLITFFAGFATAIYCLAPVPDNQKYLGAKKGFAHSALKSDEFAKSFNSKMHQYIDFLKDTSYRAGDYIKQELEERKIGC